MIDQPDPRLISYESPPCVHCGRCYDVPAWHRITMGHWPKPAVEVNAERRLIAADGEIGARAP